MNPTDTPTTGNAQNSTQEAQKTDSRNHSADLSQETLQNSPQDHRRVLRAVPQIPLRILPSRTLGTIPLVPLRILPSRTLGTIPLVPLRVLPRKTPCTVPRRPHRLPPRNTLYKIPQL